jgi:hypothetical protein
MIKISSDFLISENIIQAGQKEFIFRNILFAIIKDEKERVIKDTLILTKWR